MFESTREILQTIKKQDSEWEEKIKRYLSDDDNNTEDELTEQFWKMMDSLCNAIRDGDGEKEEALDLFGQGIKKEIDNLLSNELRPYYGFKKKKKNEIDNADQLMNLIDLLWPQYIVKRNPAFKLDKSRYSFHVSEEEIEEFVITLAAIVDHCISTLLNYEGMIYIIRRQTGLSEEMSSYIARKIERNYEELRINFIIKRLTKLS